MDSAIQRLNNQGLGGLSDWLKEISPRGTTNQKHYPDLDSDTSLFMPSPSTASSQAFSVIAFR